MPFTAPEPLAAHHQFDNFDCGEVSLNEWLKSRGRASDADGGSHVYVVCDGTRVVAYYTLSSYSIAQTLPPGRFKRNMPNPIPAMLLGRLAVDRRAQGLRLGSGLIKDAAKRVLQASAIVGVRGIVVHAISERAKKFYIDCGFTACQTEPMTLVVTLQDVRAALDI